jgi:uroporphyrinogen decarboxylase
VKAVKREAKTVKTEPMSDEQRPSAGVRRDFAGLRVVAFESRQATETQRLIEKSGGVAIIAPSLRELPIEANDVAFTFARRLLDGAYDAVVCMTGVGTRYLFQAMETRHPRDELVAALGRTTVVARGPKPVRALRELGVPIAITVPEPNTWREILTAMDEANEGVAIAGARIAVQEYGEPNDRFVAALRERGAIVETVPVYRWALPENVAPLVGALRQVIARTVDIALFTSATQVRHVLAVAEKEGIETALRSALDEVVVASVGPICTEALVESGLRADFEPSQGKLGVLVRETSERALELLAAKRRRPPTRARVVERRSAEPDASARVENSVFMKACRLEPTPHTPVWLMRQAGRYMQEYRELRARVPFIELCKTPELAAEVAVTAVERLGVDAAILFSDILLIIEPMGLGLEYVHGEGPSISRVVAGANDVALLREVNPAESLAFVFDAVRKTREALDPSVPLIGFSGAPFTLASYIIEGGGSRNYVATKSLMYRDSGAWHAMMELIARAVTRYLCGQVQAGCQALQLFDSWVGCLSPADYERFVLPHTRAVIEALPPDVPVIHFGTDTATLLDLQARCGGSVLGVDHRTPIGEVCARFPKLAIQGNLDPVVLHALPSHIRSEAKRILDEVADRPGHIFNLGHGILPGTPVDHAIALVDAVHELSTR